jgi:4-amino-4-deoxy-L-arabinose transferase-like glycosyltransferase
MAGRHSLLAVVLFAVILHAIAITQTILPAQDGLKFIRIARLFHSQSWTDVIRGSDTHPLYPALIAAAEPAVAAIAGHGPDTWRLAAQIVAVFGSLGLLLPMFGLTRALFDRRIACLAAALAVLLPRTAELGHDTLSDSLGLLCTFLALWLGAIALRRGEWRFALVAGLAAGLGYLARPEVILVPFAIGLTWLIGLFRDSRARTVARGPALALMLVTTMSVIGYYAMVKGEISEKLAIRYGAWLSPKKPATRLAPPGAARGLDDPRWDFSPKEETDRIPIQNWEYAVLRIIGKWWEELCWLFAVMTVWGIVRQRYIRGLCADRNPHDGEVERRLLLVFAAVYGLALVRHSSLLGYLSGRHIMALVYASVPWAAAGSFVCARGIAVKRRWGPRFARNVGIVGALLLVAASIGVQMRPNHLNHLSRWGHWSAGQWLAGNARPTEMVLDTRGWARFVSGQPGYDYWHVRQALTDSHLSYIIVGLDELEARSSRARTLKALLAYSATQLKEFPAFPGDRTPGVRLYRFHRPGTWEGLVP